MVKQYSIASARDQLARVVHEAEAGSPIELTRRGRPVAVILALGEYEQLKSSPRTFREAFDAFRSRVDLKGLAIDPAEIWGVARDRSPGREVRL
jgi:prevent-host-death family protein